MVLEKLAPELVWSIFENIIAATPHISYHEEELRTKIKEYVRAKSKENDLGITITVTRILFSGSINGIL